MGYCAFLGSSHDRGADIGEVLSTAEKILPGSFETWYEQFKKFADRVRFTVDQKSDLHPVSVGNAMFRAASLS
jgi:hypothetical protein